MKPDEVLSLINDAYRRGWERGVSDYAVWKDGEQMVGVMQKTLSKVIETGPNRDHVVIDLLPLQDKVCLSMIGPPDEWNKDEEGWVKK